MDNIKWETSLMLKKKKLTFVIPKFIEKENEYYEIPLGILYIATLLKKQNYVTHILDMNLYAKDTEHEILRRYLSENPTDIILTGGLSAFFFSIERVLCAVKELDKTIITILGGGIVTSDKEIICKELNPDFAIIGEGELTALELIDTINNNSDFDNILGIGYRSNEEWIFTAERPVIDDLDSLPFPDFSMIDLEEYFKRQTPISSNYLYPLDFPRALPLITSRSCPLNCTFCFHPIGQKYRIKSLDYVFNEIEYMVNNYHINMIVVMDEMMSANKKRLIEFSERIKKYNLLWTCQLWTISVDNETLRLMKDSGCYLISYGLESVNKEVLESMKKPTTTKENIETSLDMTKNNHITIQGNFIFGDPAETVATSDETLQWWEQNPEYQISLGRVAPYPGTPLYKYALANGLIKNPIKFIRDGTPSINLTKMTMQEYAELTSKIATYSSKARQYCKVISVDIDPRTSYESYKCQLQCPHCGTTTTYGNIFIEKPTIFKLACRHCALRFDVNPRSFPNLKKVLHRHKKHLLELRERCGSFVISPAVFENVFIEYFSLIGIDYNDLPITYILDSNETRHGNFYLDKYQILKRDEKNLSDWKDSAVIIMPSLYRKDIINEFSALGIAPENIFAVEVQ